jgi:hypothetical protein
MMQLLKIETTTHGYVGMAHSNVDIIVINNGYDLSIP